MVGDVMDDTLKLVHLFLPRQIRPLHDHHVLIGVPRSTNAFRTSVAKESCARMVL